MNRRSKFAALVLSVAGVLALGFTPTVREFRHAPPEFQLEIYDARQSGRGLALHSAVDVHRFSPWRRDDDRWVDRFGTPWSLRDDQFDRARPQSRLVRDRVRWSALLSIWATLGVLAGVMFTLLRSRDRVPSRSLAGHRAPRPSGLRDRSGPSAQLRERMRVGVLVTACVVPLLIIPVWRVRGRTCVDGRIRTSEHPTSRSWRLPWSLSERTEGDDGDFRERAWDVNWSAYSAQLVVAALIGGGALALLRLRQRRRRDGVG